MLPFIKIFSKEIATYPLSVLIGCIIGFLVGYYRCKRAKLSYKNAAVIAICGWGIGFFGAKLMYIIITYSLKEVIDCVMRWDFKLFADGGLVFYGGLIGGVCGALVGAWLVDARIGTYEKVLVPIIPLVHAFGRIGCLLAGCCYGKPVSSGIAVIYTNPLSDAPIGVSLAPVQAYEAIYNVLLFILLSVVCRKNNNGKLIFPLYIALYGIGRFILEYYRYDEIRGIALGISTSQYISIGLVLTAIIMYMSRKRGKK